MATPVLSAGPGWGRQTKELQEEEQKRFVGIRIFTSESFVYTKKLHLAVLGEKNSCGHFRPTYFINANCQIQHASQPEKQEAENEECIHSKRSAGPSVTSLLAGNQK